MKRIFAILLFILLSCVGVSAQYYGPARRLGRLTTEPAICNPGDVYHNLTTHKNRQCLTLNTWSDFGSGSGSGTVTNVTGTTPINVATTTTTPVVSCATCEVTGNKDAANGYAGLDASTLLKGAEFPAFTGDATKPSGSLVTTVVKVNGNTPGGTCTNQFAGSIDSSGRPSCRSVSLTADVSGTLPATNGGTGQSTYAKGDILASPGSNTLNKLGVGSDGQVLTVDVASTNGMKWAAAAGSSIAPLVITDANTIEQYNSTNAQAFNIYNTRTDASNYERLNVGWTGNELFIQTQSAGTGTNRNIKLIPSGNLVLNVGGFTQFSPGGTNTWYMDPSSHNLLANNDNTNNFGEDAANRPANVNAGTKVKAPTINATTNYQINGVTVYSGGTPSIAGNATLNTGSKDSAGKVTATGTGASTIVLTFSITFTRAPACFVTNETTSNLVRPVSTTTTLTFNATIVNGDSLSYQCTGY